MKNYVENEIKRRKMRVVKAKEKLDSNTSIPEKKKKQFKKARELFNKECTRISKSMEGKLKYAYYDYSDTLKDVKKELQKLDKNVHFLNKMANYDS